MSYYFQFAPHLEWDHQNIIYDVHDFLEPPFMVSVPQLTSIVKEFLRTFEIVGLVEPNHDSHSGNGSHEKTRPSLQLVTDYAYLIQVNKLKKETVNTLCMKLVKYLQDGVSELSNNNGDRKILDTTWASYFAGLHEIATLRNFLSRFTTSRKKVYRQGYIFVMEG